MNSRPIPEHAAEKNNVARPEQTGDQRALILLLIGLVVIAVHLAGGNGPKAAAGHEADSLVWLAGSSFQEGIYSVNSRLLPPKTDNLSVLYRCLGLTPPAVPDLEAGGIAVRPDQLTPLALRLENGRLPTVIGPPAVFHSFMFLPIPINEASRELLITVPGIGPRLAEQILALRDKKKQLAGPEDLLAIPGIGRVRLQHLAEHLSFKQSGL
jgi:hypothetical protein